MTTVLVSINSHCRATLLFVADGLRVGSDLKNFEPPVWLQTLIASAKRAPAIESATKKHSLYPGQAIRISLGLEQLWLLLLLLLLSPTSGSDDAASRLDISLSNHSLRVLLALLQINLSSSSFSVPLVPLDLSS